MKKLFLTLTMLLVVFAVQALPFVTALGDDSQPVSELTFTPFNVYTPNNVVIDPNEDHHKLFDKDLSTKWCVENTTGSWEPIWVDFISNVAFIPTGYTINPASDTHSWPGRNPKAWKIYAKANLTDEWTTISNMISAGLPTSQGDHNYAINNVHEKYQYFRFEVIELCGRGGWNNNHYVFQLAELALKGQWISATGEVVLSDLEIHDDHCNFSASYTGDEPHQIKLTVNGEPLENPGTVFRTNLERELNVEATVIFSDSRILTLTASKTYTIPALGNPLPVEATFTPYAVHAPNNANASNENENHYKLFDKDLSTKWCVDNSTGSWEPIWVDFMSDVAFIPTGYTINPASDTHSWPGRNPKAWKIYAKANESDAWKTISHVPSAGLPTSQGDHNYAINNVHEKYQYFRFEVIELCGRGGWNNNHYVFQLAELALKGYTAGAVAITGDVNGDNVVDVEDVNATINIILKLKTQDEYVGKADVTGDDIVDVEDVNKLINIILKPD
ncbi:MAG: hypothetical protein J6S96_00785 [Muribaculaceae bacterium]|nr:hypothetical protein [Muribaculaceae bacterium]